jgi:BirA family biotin operon repressor/biotin-[acetyl-CoA-carboxylase] ligase
VTTPSAAILRLFREQGGFVSGEMISRELHVSRTAIWKQINALRKAGYVIQAVPSRGYQLMSAPDLLTSAEVAAQLDAAVVGRRIVFLEETSSTNGDAFRLAEQGGEEGTVVLADSQNGGKGRMGRVWTSPAGVNLYCSVILRPGGMPYEAPQLTFLSAVAVARAIERVSALRPEIKWPNDVLIRGRKVAGLLNEMSAETDGINFVILGIGVNLNMTGEQFPSDLRHPATSLLLESGRPVGRARFCAAMLNELDHLYAAFRANGFGPVREEWQRRCNAHGRELAVSDGGAEIVRGMFAGIDGSGALLVSGTDGTVSKILSGDVRVL